MANNEVVQKWITALESGDFEQTQGCLGRPATAESPRKYCCLGVLSELAVRDGIIPAPTVNGIGELVFGDDALTLPEAVRTWADLRYYDPEVRIENPAYTGDPDNEPKFIERSLSYLNDGEHMSFAQIAQIIRDEILEDED